VTRTLRRLIVTIAVPVALLVSGCGTPQSGAAAVVGDRRIPVSEVQDAFRDIAVLIGQDGQISQADMLTYLVLEPYLSKAAADAGDGVSMDEAKKQFDEVKDKLPEPSHGALLVARAVVARDKIQAALPADQAQRVFEGIVEQLRAEKVEVNPRFGASFDYGRLVVVQGSENWLRTPEPTASAAAPGQGTEPPPEESLPEESLPEGTPTQ
jgi:hypothetical protein